MADPFQTLKDQKEKILQDAKRQAEALDSDLHELERMQALAEKYGLALTEKKSANGVETDGLHAQTEPVAMHESPPVAAYKQAFNAAEKLVRSHGRPMELKEIYPRLVRQGVPLAGVRPQSTLSAYLSHPKSPMVSVRKGLWWVKGEPIPED